MQRQFDDVTFYGQGLSAEAQQVLNDVNKAMQPWIEKSVETLYKSATAEADGKLKELQNSIDSTDKLLAELNTSLNNLQNDLNQVMQLSGQAQQIKIKELAAAIQGAKNDLLERQAKWENFGKAVATKAIQAGAASLGFPPLA